MQNCLTSVRNSVTASSLVTACFLNEEWRILSSPSRCYPSQTIATFDSECKFVMSSWSIALSNQLSNTAACLHLPPQLFFSSLRILSLLSLITEVLVEATD